MQRRAWPSAAGTRKPGGTMTAARSLDTAQAGELVMVRRILFDTLRSHCSERGVREGARLRVRAGDAGRVELETTGGRAVPCERRYARFIQVASAPVVSGDMVEVTGGESGDDGAGA